MRATAPFLLLLLGAARAQADEPRRVGLEGAAAAVTPPGAGWEPATQTPEPGHWRIVYRGPAAQCEARVFPVQDERAAGTVLMEAADEVARHVGGDGPGVPSLRVLQLDGREAAESDLIVQAGQVRLEGRIRLLRVDPLIWALAWGLAPVDAAPSVRRAATEFASSLRPSVPAFYEPEPSPEDPEQALLTAPGEPPVLRRHLDSVLGLLEAGAGLRFPRAARRAVLEALVDEGRQGGASAREALRESARVVAEAAGKPAEERAEIACALGTRSLDRLFARADTGYEPAQRVAGQVALGRRIAVGSAEDGLTRFELEALLEGCAFLAAFAADAALEPDEALRAPQREVLAARWTASGAEGRAALERFAAAAPDLADAWRRADAPHRFALRAAVIEALLPAVAAPPATPPAPPTLESLRARLDAAPRDPPALFGACCALDPSERLRLSALLR